MLHGGGLDRVRQTTVVDKRVGGQVGFARRRNDPATPVSKAIPIGCNRNWWVGDDVVWVDEVGNATVMDVQ